MGFLVGPREAKEFLIAKIVEEALQQGISLSDVERKMLYFSETHWTLPDIWQVNEDFERSYDNEEYEAKIISLVKEAYERAKRKGGAGMWRDAVQILDQEDHYLLVFIHDAGVQNSW